MSGNLDERDRAYYQRRAEQERNHAARTDDVTARRVHSELAERYSSLLFSAATPASPEA